MQVREDGSCHQATLGETKWRFTSTWVVGFTVLIMTHPEGIVNDLDTHDRTHTIYCIQTIYIHLNLVLLFIYDIYFVYMMLWKNNYCGIHANKSKLELNYDSETSVIPLW